MEDELSHADNHDVALAQPQGVDTLTVDKRAVGRAEVLDPPAVSLGHKRCVLS
jgi:hypothetical protein